MLDSEKFIFGKILNPIVKLCCILNIHPNIITISSFISTILMLNFHKNNQYKYFIYAIIYKWLSDGLDGEVARHCNKTSKLGGILDFYADAFFFLIFVKILLSFFINDDISWIIVIFISKIYELIFIHHYGNEAIYNHDLIKKNSHNIYKRISAFFVNNIMLYYIILVFLYDQLSHKK